MKCWAALRTQLEARPALQPWLDRRERLLRLAVFSLIVNLLYAFYHGALGLLQGSVWFGASCVYYLLLGLFRFGILLSKQEGGERLRRFTGALLTLLGLALGLILALSLHQSRAVVYGLVPMLAIATYTFAKITVAVVNGVRHRAEPSGRLRSLQVLRWSEAALSLFTMQQSMLATFGDINDKSSGQLNRFTGISMCLFVGGLGLWLLTTKEKKGRNETMAKSKLIQTGKKIADAVTGAYQTVEDGVVGGYKKMETGVVQGYQKIEDAFVDRYLTREGETVEEAKARLKKED